MKPTVVMVTMLAILMLVASCSEKTTEVSVISAPVISPQSGSWETIIDYNTNPPTVVNPISNIADTLMLKISCATPGVVIRFTVDGSDPIPTSMVYTNPFKLKQVFAVGADSAVIKAQAFKESERSAITTANYTFFYDDNVAPPDISPVDSTIEVGSQLILSCPTLGSLIRYTLDGTEPTLTSRKYENPVRLMLKTGPLEVRAKAFRASTNPSETVVKNYELTYTPPEMIAVPQGTINNGTSTATISGFMMDKCEMTQKGYAAVMGQAPSQYGINLNYPVERVSWFNAIEYCNRRSIHENLEPCYSYSTYGTNPDDWPVGWDISKSNHEMISCTWSAPGYRLPTEMEWMYAANGEGPELNYPYSGSATIGDVAWYVVNVGNPPSPKTVGTKAANAFGLNDMSGNVWEWVWDIYDITYPAGDQENPTGPTSGGQRTYRGGSWTNSPVNCQIDTRMTKGAPEMAYDIGFRVVKKTSSN